MRLEDVPHRTTQRGLAAGAGRWIVALLLLAAACGNQADNGTTVGVDDQDAASPAPPSTGTAESDTTPGSTSTSTDPSTTRERPPLPATGCVEPVGVGTEEFSIIVEDRERPVDVEWTAASAEVEDPGLVVALHGGGPGLGSDVAIGDKSRWEAALGPLVFVKPQASVDEVRFWSESDTFNVSYMNTLWEAISGGLCFDRDRVVLLGLGQGSLVVVQSICSTAIPMSVAVLQFGLIKPSDCEPSRPVPIVSVNVLDPSPNGGGSWYEKWTPPVPFEVELTGGIGPVPEDMAEWAGTYSCTEELTEETAGEAIWASYPDCEPLLVAVGLPNSGPGEPGPDPDQLALTWPRFLTTITSVLDG